MGDTVTRNRRTRSSASGGPFPDLAVALPGHRWRRRKHAGASRPRLLPSPCAPMRLPEPASSVMTGTGTARLGGLAVRPPPWQSDVQRPVGRTGPVRPHGHLGRSQRRPRPQPGGQHCDHYDGREQPPPPYRVPDRRLVPHGADAVGHDHREAPGVRDPPVGRASERTSAARDRRTFPSTCSSVHRRTSRKAP